MKKQQHKKVNNTKRVNNKPTSVNIYKTEFTINVAYNRKNYGMFTVRMDLAIELAKQIAKENGIDTIKIIDKEYYCPTEIIKL